MASLKTTEGATLTVVLDGETQVPSGIVMIVDVLGWEKGGLKMLNPIALQVQDLLLLWHQAGNSTSGVQGMRLQPFQTQPGVCLLLNILVSRLS